MFDWTSSKIIDIYGRNKCPQNSQPFPAVRAKYRKKQGGDHNGSYRSPTIKRVKQAHRRLFVVKWTCLHNRTAKHFNQTASDCIHNNTQDHSDKRFRQKIRQKRQTNESRCRTNLRSNNTDSIPYFIHKLCAKQIYQQLCKEKAGRDQCNFSKCNLIIMMKF